MHRGYCRCFFYILLLFLMTLSCEMKKHRSKRYLVFPRGGSYKVSAKQKYKNLSNFTMSGGSMNNYFTGLFAFNNCTYKITNWYWYAALNLGNYIPFPVKPEIFCIKAWNIFLLDSCVKFEVNFIDISPIFLDNTKSLSQRVYCECNHCLLLFSIRIKILQTKFTLSFNKIFLKNGQYST